MLNENEWEPKIYFVYQSFGPVGSGFEEKVRIRIQFEQPDLDLGFKFPGHLHCIMFDNRNRMRSFLDRIRIRPFLDRIQIRSFLDRIRKLLDRIRLFLDRIRSFLDRIRIRLFLVLCSSNYLYVQNYVWKMTFYVCKTMHVRWHSM